MSTWIFLRGLTRESRHWRGFPEVFRREVPHAEIHTPDLPGNGSLNGLPSPLDIAEMADWCRTGLLARGVSPPYHVLALSLGAMVAVAWATRHPMEIRSCVLVNTSLRPLNPFYLRLKPSCYAEILRLACLGNSARERESGILELTAHHADNPAEVLQDWIAFHEDRPVSSWNAARQMLAAARYQAPLVKPVPPVLILASRQDKVVDSRCSHRLASIWNAELAEHPTAGHDITLDDGPWVARQISRWLQAQRRTEAGGAFQALGGT